VVKALRRVYEFEIERPMDEEEVSVVVVVVE
jgi:hypothetical protein